MKGGCKGMPRNYIRKRYKTFKAFDYPHITIISKDSVQYLLYPLRYNYHKLNKVPVKYWWDLWLHCEKCKIMGRLETFNQYHCLA